MNPIRKRDAPFLTRLPSPEHRPGDGDSSEDEEYVTLSTPVDTPASTLEEVEVDKQSTIDEPVTDLSSDIQPCLIMNQMNQKPDSDSESDSDSSAPIIPRRSARSIKGIPSVCYGQVQIKSTIISDINKPTRYR